MSSVCLDTIARSDSLTFVTLSLGAPLKEVNVALEGLLLTFSDWSLGRCLRTDPDFAGEPGPAVDS